MTLPIDIDRAEIEAYCKKWKIIEFSFFGSILRDDFGPDSDVDVLVVFDPNEKISAFDFIDAEEELSRLLKRPVDLVERIAVERSRNPIRRQHILDSAMYYYVA